MSVRFVGQDIEWTDEMRERVRAKIVQPLQQHLKGAAFELSVHLGFERARGDQQRLEMWVVLQPLNGETNVVVRSGHADFNSLTTDISSQMRVRLHNKPAPRRRFTLNPFRYMPFERTA